MQSDSAVSFSIYRHSAQAHNAELRNAQFDFAGTFGLSSELQITAHVSCNVRTSESVATRAHTHAHAHAACLI